MKTTLLLCLLVSTSAFASREKIFECNISSGDLQAADVYRENGKLILEKLTSRGATEKRALNEKDFASNVIRFSIAKDKFPGKITKDRDGYWFYEMGDPSFRSIGYCR